ncbi:MAG TPA: ABC transporter substrate-binding protein [Xanthobacteraceae bacterium]|nr:ABC transporter substrate-binding protein [Xanthobacteraceae bacterium]
MEKKNWQGPDGVIGKTSPLRAPQIIANAGIASLNLTLAVCDYEHVRDLTSGVVRVDGIALTPLVFPSIEEITFRFTRNVEWDVSELSFGKYTALTAKGNAPMIAIPVFPSRVHRHSAIYVRSDRGIRTPKDLEGKTVGIPEWAQTAGIYVRGFLAERYGVDLAAIKWLQAGVDEAGRDEKVALKLPNGIRYQARPDTSISAMLESGEIDAAITARAPLAFARAPQAIVRLFPNYRAEEERLFKETGVFPIMHLITMRRAVFEQYPWVAMNLFKAFEEAKRRCFERLRDFTLARAPLPWIAAIADEMAERFGPDPYPYGVEASRKTIEAFCRYAHAQGVTERLMTSEDLFPPEVRAVARV